ncbi:hypothetical protein FB192DRAFT_1037065 [Mucor lusitanicus]|nr:hypothetical protein FB192DRAFT_1037065 [Mucor lusitanicus]
MEPLYDQLLQQKFASSTDAIEFCREACQEYGFPIKHETNSNRSIYIYCAHDNPLLSDALQQQQQTPPLRKRPSSLKNAAAAAASSAAAQECKWRVVLTENELSNEWTFRKSLNPQAFEHNHLLSDNEPSVWPQQVYDRIIQLARQKNMQTDEIRDTIKLQFPDITWNDRRFSNCLVEERKRMRQKSVTDKVQRLVMASTRLCSVVAANEDWASCVEGELVKMLENYKHLSRIPNQHMVDSMVDLQIDMIHSEIDKNRRPSAKQQHQEEDLFSKKRRTSSASAALRNEGIQVMSVPSCTLYIRSQPLRSLSEPSSQNRRAFTDLIAASSGAAVPQQHHHHHHHSQQQQHHPHHHHQQQQQHRHHQQQHHHHHQQQLPFGVSTVFTMTSPVSSPSSTSSLQQRVDYNNYRNSGNNDMLQSPPIPDSTNMIMSSGYNGGNDAYTPHPPTPSSNYNGSAAAAAAAVAAATGDINFSFDPNAMTNTTPSYSQHVPASPAPLVVHRQHQQQPTTERMTGYPTSMGGYYSNSSSSMGREASPSTTSIQQRIMLQQEYEQHQRHLQQMESSSAAAVAAAAVANVHLPLIRSNNSTSSLNATMVQQQHHHHPGSNLNPNHPQNWS